MSDMNKYFISGRLVSDPEESGKTETICKFTVASNEHYGEGKEKTAFVPITVFGPQGKVCLENLKKGDSVIIECKVETNTVASQDGKKKKFIDFIAKEVHFIRTKKA